MSLYPVSLSPSGTRHEAPEDLVPSGPLSGRWTQRSGPGERETLGGAVWPAGPQQRWTHRHPGAAGRTGRQRAFQRLRGESKLARLTHTHTHTQCRIRVLCVSVRIQNITFKQTVVRNKTSEALFDHSKESVIPHLFLQHLCPAKCTKVCLVSPVSSLTYHQL